MYYVRRLIVTLATLFFLVTTAYSQSVTTEVFVNSVINFESGNTNLNCTLGENFIETFEISSGIQTLGFNQTFLEVSLVEAPLLDENMQLWVC